MALLADVVTSQIRLHEVAWAAGCVEVHYYQPRSAEVVQICVTMKLFHQIHRSLPTAAATVLVKPAQYTHKQFILVTHATRVAGVRHSSVYRACISVCVFVSSIEPKRLKLQSLN